MSIMRNRDILAALRPVTVDIAMRSRRVLALGLVGVGAGGYGKRRWSRARAGWRPPGGRTETTSGLAARVLGDHGTPVVLLHGLVASGIYWGADYDHPDRVAGLVAFGPPLYPDRRAALAHVGGTGPMGRLFVLPGRPAQITCQWVCRHRGMST